MPRSEDARTRMLGLQADLAKWKRFANERTGVRRKEADAEVKFITRKINTLRALNGI